MKKALKYLISVIIAIIVAGFFIYLLIPALTGFMTLMVCTAVAGMVSEFRGEESVKVILSERDSDRTEESLVANATLLFARTGGCISCRKFKINSKETSDGGTYLMDSIPVMQELQTERGYYTHHKGYSSRST